MIYTVTFNPAIDYVMNFNHVEMGKTNRSSYEYIQMAGKGINVSVVLKALGVPSVALGFVAGFTGAAIKNDLEKNKIETNFVFLKNGISRINIKVKSETETELNSKGPDIEKSDLEEFFKKLDCLKNGDTLVLAGSVPGSLPSNIYCEIMEYVSGKNIKFVVDAEGDLLINALKHKPFLIKPNHNELGAIFSKTLSSHDEIIECAKKLQSMGAKNVLVSMAENGAILLDQNGFSHFCPAFSGKVKNSAGAGDSMVAGFLAGLETNDFDYALKLGTAAGSATAFSPVLAEKDEIFNLINNR